MFRTASRIVVRQSSAALSGQARTRFISTTPPLLKSRSWRSSAIRWGIAAAGVYYYNTGTIFAEEPPALSPRDGQDSETLPTLDSYTPSSRKKQAPASAQLVQHDQPFSDEYQPQSAEELEEDAHDQGAFNEETGEINWDCPCLGGMAYGPCGPEFREAFSCFVYSKDEPKGMDCIDKFKGMQECFRQNPDVYQAELEDDEQDEEGALVQEEGVHVAAAQPEDTPSVVAAVKNAENEKKAPSQDKRVQEPRPQEVTSSDLQREAMQPVEEDSNKQNLNGESDSAKTSTTGKVKNHDIANEIDKIEGDLIPKQAHDARDAASPSSAK